MDFPTQCSPYVYLMFPLCSSIYKCTHARQPATSNIIAVCIFILQVIHKCNYTILTILLLICLMNCYTHSHTLQTYTQSHLVPVLIIYLTYIFLFYIKDILLTRKDKTMTRNQFIQICNSYCILPEIAIENENIIDTLINETNSIIATSLIELILATEF